MVRPELDAALRPAPAISASVSGVSTTNGYSTRQSVASVTCETRDRPSNLMLSLAVYRRSSACACAGAASAIASKLRGEGRRPRPRAASSSSPTTRVALRIGVRRAALLDLGAGGGAAPRPAGGGAWGCRAGRPAGRDCAAPPRCRPAPRTACAPSGRCGAPRAAGSSTSQARAPEQRGSRSRGRRTTCSCTESRAGGARRRPDRARSDLVERQWGVHRAGAHARPT